MARSSVPFRSPRLLPSAIYTSLSSESRGCRQRVNVIPAAAAKGKALGFRTVTVTFSREVSSASSAMRDASDSIDW
jgi:hypothetical protein